MWQSVASGDGATLVMPSPGVSCSKPRGQWPGGGAGNANGWACHDGVQPGGAST